MICITISQKHKCKYILPDFTLMLYLSNSKHPQNVRWCISSCSTFALALLACLRCSCIKFHINMKYNTWSTNHVSYCLSRPPVAAPTTVLHYFGHEAFEWPQLYQHDPDFTTTYQLLGTDTNITDFHIQDRILCHLGHLYVLTREHENIIWEAHYSQMAGHFGMEKTMVVLQKKIIGKNFDRTSTSILDIALSVPLPSHPSRRKSYTLLFLLPRGLGNPSRWITCLTIHPPSKEMIVYLCWLIGL
jgi:hypothetical protein